MLRPLRLWLSCVAALALFAACSDGEPKFVDNPGFTADLPYGVDGNAYSKDAGALPGATTGGPTPGPGACTPQCFGKACGDDGCGGTCGSCLEGYHCTNSGLCISDDCEPKCAGKICGDDECGGTCGDCGPGMTCTAGGFCTNEPCQGDCIGKECGDDGCGQSCGACGPGATCSGSGMCIPENCKADCFGKQCGDDGCGGQCGKCAPDQVCDGTFQCVQTEAGCGGVPESGTCEGNTVKWCFNGNIYTLNCDPSVGLVCGWNDTQSKFDCVPGDCQPTCVGKQCGPDGCGGKCGICPAGESCTPASTCQDNCIADCGGKQCGPNGCGGTCGTCPGGQVCGGSGQCQAGNCVPNCVGMQCGPDGCGGKCGICPAGESCTPGGTCQAGGCTPDCVGKQCGADGCGGSCGNCPGGQSCGPGFKCVDGGCSPNCAGKQCGDNGCGGLCGQCQPGQSCSPQGSCQDGGCTTDCAGKQCGPDGCGGKCGICPAGLNCAAGGLCEDAGGCTAECAGKDCGPDGCGGKCGICGAGLTCGAGGLCEVTGGGGACGDIDFKGVCEGTVLKYCSGESLTVIECADQGLECGFDPENEWFDCVEPGSCVPDCTGKECGSDGCGGSCGDCVDGVTCNASGQCVEQGGGECGDITFVGVCEGDLLKYCSADTLKVVDCTEQGMVCGFVADQEWYDCIEGGGCTPDCTGKVAGDPDGCGGTCEGGGDPGGCGDIDLQGECVGDVLHYCSGGELQEVDCAAQGKSCGFDAQFEWFDCVDGAGCIPDCEGKQPGDPNGCGGTCPGVDPPDGACGEVTTEGMCEGNTLKYCSNGEIQEFDCTQFDKVCGFDEQFAWYDCVDGGGPCAPDCAGKPEGAADGCGGTCQGGVDPGGCGDVTSAGECQGKVLVYCAGEEVVTFDCASQGKTCGFDEQFEWYDCVDGDDPCTPDCTGKVGGDPDGCGGTCAGEPGAGCGSVDSNGECDGNTLKYCAGGELKVFDCGDLGKVCGFDAQFEWYDCVDGGGPCTPDCGGKPAGSPDGCGGTCDGGAPGCGDITVKGECAGDTLTYCSGEDLAVVDCATQGKTCGYDSQFDWFDCVDGGGDPCIPDCAGKPDGAADGCGGTCAGSGGGCGDIDTSGVCEGDTLKYCSNGALQTFDCTEYGKTCGFDAQFDWYDCVDTGGPCTPDCADKPAGAPDGCGGTCAGDPGGGCGDIDTKGTCDGDTLKYCSNGALQTFDCTEFDKVCGYDAQFDWYDCVTGGGCVPDCAGKAAGDPDGCGGTCDGGGSDCGDIDLAGQCDGNVLSYCSNGSPVTVDCAAQGKVCGFDEQFDWYDCLESGGCVPDCAGKAAGEPDGCGGTCAGDPGGECGDITTAGECDGDTLKYCSNGAVQSFDCTEFGKVCGFDEQFDWYDCVDDGSCTPSCAGAECGDDGCGGSCGGCGAGAVCEAGQCVPEGGTGCGGIDTNGECDGNILKYCSAGTLKTYDCGELGKVCGFDEQFEWYDCVDDGGPCTPDCAGKGAGDPDGCGGICPGDPGGGCGDLDVKGKCEGSVLSYCSNGAPVSFDCASQGKVCGYDEQFDWFDCVDEGGSCIPDCNSKQCGSDGCGGSCGTCGDGESCSATFQCVGADACGGVTTAGECDGDTLKYCSNGQLQTFDCTSYGKVCGFDEQFDWYDCVEDPTGCTPSCDGKNCGSDGCGDSCGTCGDSMTCSAAGLCEVESDCGDITTAGTCEGDTLKYCSGGSLKTFDCASLDKTCGFDEQFDWFDCVEEGGVCTPDCGGKVCGTDGCGGSCGTCLAGQTCSAAGQCIGGEGECGNIDSKGVCEGNTLKYCSNGSLKEFDCTSYSKVCGYDEQFDWYDCVDDASCTPNCSGKQCGDDGCGGSCGTCTGGESCTPNGQCTGGGTDNCGGVTTQGQCSGNTLEYCSNGELKTFDCTSFGKICGFDAQFDWYDCIEDSSCTPSCAGKQCGDDGCGGSCGTCAGGETCDAAGQCTGGGGGNCGSIDTKGECSGNTLKYCSNGDLKTFDCTDSDKICGYDATYDWYDCVEDPTGCTPSCGGKECGSDGCGGSCGSCGGGEVCSSGQCVSDGGNCGGVDSTGTCEGNTLKYCANGELKTFNCTDFGKVCGYDSGNQWYDCIEDPNACTPSCGGKQCGSDGCGGSCGSCGSGTTCNASGQCVANDNCGGVDAAGTCDGETLKYCSNGELKTFYCPSYGKICGYDSSSQWYDCIEDPNACTPSCGGKECGSDGCGGSCGSCGSGETCSSGQCISSGGGGCGGITYEGTCQGNVLKYCDNGSLQTIDCAAYNGICEYDASKGYYDCNYN